MNEAHIAVWLGKQLLGCNRFLQLYKCLSCSNDFQLRWLMCKASNIQRKTNNPWQTSLERNICSKKKEELFIFSCMLRIIVGKCYQSLKKKSKIPPGIYLKFKIQSILPINSDTECLTISIKFTTFDKLVVSSFQQ